jgi:hypothetical protein
MLVFHSDLENKIFRSINDIEMMLIPVSLSRKVHLKNGNVDGELTETRLDDEEDSAMMN